MNLGLGVRYDLTEDGLVARQLNGGRVLWKRDAADATMRGDLIVCISRNRLMTYGASGRLRSQRRLTRSSIQWESLDPQLRYALGFRLKPDKPNTWPMFLLDLRSLKVRQLPIIYDLGGHVNPAVISSKEDVLIFDTGYTYAYANGKLTRPKWRKPIVESEYGIIHAGVFNDRVFVIEQKLATEASRILDAKTGRIMGSTAATLWGFLKPTGGRMFVWGLDGKDVVVFELKSLGVTIMQDTYPLFSRRQIRSTSGGFVKPNANS